MFNLSGWMNIRLISVSAEEGNLTAGFMGIFLIPRDTQRGTDRAVVHALALPPTLHLASPLMGASV